eukprot:TRINITY_DN6196_c0_g1_i10.p1 TRINITY_DN6196_c0_g1~~TRINITY_DN6196_c0_g1_i10.p1  ORF type:complete len:781 (-),score=128.45 TRINITY_DN6196_c0_g1_i10:1127-3469(-)
MSQQQQQPPLLSPTSAQQPSAGMTPSLGQPQVLANTQPQALNAATIQQTLALVQQQQAQWQHQQAQQQQQQQQQQVQQSQQQLMAQAQAQVQAQLQQQLQQGGQGQGQGQGQAGGQGGFVGGRYLPPHLRKGYTAPSDLGQMGMQQQMGMGGQAFQPRGGYQRSFSYGGVQGYQGQRGGGSGGRGGAMGGQVGGYGGYGQQGPAFQRSMSDTYARGAGRGGYGSNQRGAYGGYGGTQGGTGGGRGRMSTYGSFAQESDPFQSNDYSAVPNSGINFDAYEDIPVETSGRDVPQPIEKFDDISLGEVLMGNIRRCKYEKPTPVQKYSIPIGVAGRDLMACAQTGSGKTAAFCFPIVSRVFQMGLPLSERRRNATPYALILSPTRELSMQIHDELRKFTYQSSLKTVVIYGGAPVGEQLRNLERGCDMLVATPGRLTDLMERGRVSLSKCQFLCLDEADRMLDMGFEPQIRQIVEKEDMPPTGQRQTLLFSATFPKEIQRLAADFLNDYVFLTVGRVGSSTDLIVQHVERVNQQEKRSVLLDLLTAVEGLTLVFTETKKGADQLESFLLQNGFASTSIHGDRSQQEREFALRSFRSGRTPILVATDVAARGLDIPHVTHVINYDLPTDIDDYVHRIGRTGRAGKKGLATAMFSEKDSGLARALVETLSETNQEVPGWLQAVAASSTPYGQKNKRNNSGKFGGRDFRRDVNNSQNSNGNRSFGRDQNSFNNNNNYNSNSYNPSGGFKGFNPAAAVFNAPTQAPQPQSGSYGGGYGSNPYDSAWA